VSGRIRARIERLAPTGEGVAHADGKTVFVDGALPGELVEAVVFEEKARHLRAAVTEVHEASPERRETDAHAASCGGTDWAHFDPGAARIAKRSLFLETMQRIGGIAAGRFGELSVSASPLEYRLRNQFHVERHAASSRAGFFARRSHRVVPLDDCEIVSAETRRKIGDFAAAGALPAGRIDSLESVETGSGHRLALADANGRLIAGSPASLDVRFDGLAFRVSVGSFFQVNRYRLKALFEWVRERAAAAGAQTALDAYSGAGFFSQALVEAGARVTAVESSRSSSGDARFNRTRFASEGRLDLRHARVEEFVGGNTPPFDCVVADPPREGLKETAAALASLARRLFLYVSCEPASLARDLPVFLAAGFRIGRVGLEDLFPLTHRIEAVVELLRS